MLGAAGAGALMAALAIPSAAHAAAVAPPGAGGSHPCHPAQLAGSGGYLGGFKTVCIVSTTVPPKGDVNPYGIAVVPASKGHLVAGDVLVSNFNDSKNLQGTGTTIMEISPAGKAHVFADLAHQTKDRVGLTTALAVFSRGFVIVGSLPTIDGTARTATAGALYVLNSYGHLVETIKGGGINGPWDMASYDGGGFGVLFVTNVLNGTVAGHGSAVDHGTVVRIVLDLTEATPDVLQRQVVGSGFSEQTNAAALVIGPTGVALSRNGTLYVNDTIGNRVTAISDALFRRSSAGTGSLVSSGQFLHAPLGLVIAPDGDLIAADAASGQLVEVTPAGAQIEWPTVDSSGTPPGAGALFGLTIVPGAKGVYFVDDATNTLDIFK